MKQPKNIFMIYNKKEDELYERVFSRRNHAVNSLRQRAWVDEMDCEIKEFELIEVFK